MTQAKVDKHTKSKTADVIHLLKADHKKVKDLFEKFEDMQDKPNINEKKKEIVLQICQELTLHALAEEAIVYPIARKSIKDEDLMDEADVEHAGAKELIAQLQTMSPDDSHYNAKVTVLREYIEHHVKEEEGSMFPKLQKSDADREAMAEEVIHFKEEHEEEVKTDFAKDQPGKAGHQSHKSK
jgi:hemerythrin superfamily protein